MTKENQQLSSPNSAYQINVLNKFNDRIEEIELFFALIAKFEAVNPAQLISVDDNIHLIAANDLDIQDDDVEVTIKHILNKLRIETPDGDLLNIFKSNAVLLLYNLVESTVSNTDSFILKTITDAQMLYSQANPVIKSFWIEHCSKFDKKEHLSVAISLLDNVQTIKIDIKKQQNDNEKEFQGNLNPLEIDNLLRKYGIEPTKDKMLRKETERTAVKNIAQWRNDLAHGKYSFAEFGRNTLRYEPLSSLHKKEENIVFLKYACFLFLEIFLENVEDYTEYQRYKV